MVRGALALVALVLAALPGSGTAAAPAPVPGTAPLLSLRRVPAWLEASVAAEREATALAPVLASLGAASASSCLVATQGGRTLASDHATVPLVPASNEKLLTAAAALDVLGPGHRYTTTVVAGAAPAAGVVQGDLYLVGGGDPTLRTPQFEATLHDTVAPYTSLAALAASVRAAGVTAVTGAVVGDGSRYDALRSVAGWKPQYTADGDAGPLSGLDVDDGFHPTPAGYVGDDDPDRQAAATFATLLVGDGVTVGGSSPAPPAPSPVALVAAEAAAEATAGSGTAPAGAVEVASISSSPLSALLAPVLVPSDDTAAEEVTKEIGRATGRGGSTAGGTAAIEADLVAHDMPVDGSVIADGSGLDTADRVTCALVAATVARAEATGSPLLADLAVAGRSGTLAGRLASALTAGRVLAKTGTLDSVSALSGVVLPSTVAPAPTVQLRAPVVFSLIMNGVTGRAGIAVGDAVATALAGYPSVPDPAALGPER